jgi:hypothetical protein
MRLVIRVEEASGRNFLARFIATFVIIVGDEVAN